MGMRFTSSVERRASSVRRWVFGVERRASSVRFLPWLMLACVVAGGGASSSGWRAAEPQAPVWPPAPDLPRIRYLAAFSEPKDIGAGPSWLQRAASVLVGRKRQPRLMRPRGMAVDGRGRLLVADPEQRMVHVVDVAARRYSYLEPAPFASPVAIAVGRDDAIYITDSVRRRIFVYDRDGKQRAALGVVRGEAIFLRPTGISVASDGSLVVVDTLGCTVTTMSPDGRVVNVAGRRGSGEGELNYPTDVAVARDGRIFVVDSMNARIEVFGRDGSFVSQFGVRGNGTGDLDKPKGVALDSDGHVYVAEGMHDVVQVFDQQGRLLLVVGGSGRASGQFSLPSSVYVDAADHVYVADALNARVQVFQYVSQPDAR
jgi:DNA-binding beta-propeller fold protein YncE